MLSAALRAFAIVMPIAAVATVLLNVFDASRALAFAVLLPISGAGSILAIWFDARSDPTSPYYRPKRRN
jgi:hypothetical protein